MRNLETAKSTNGKVNKRVKGEHIRNFLREKKNNIYMLKTMLNKLKNWCSYKIG